jgi:hypothetical protein
MTQSKGQQAKSSLLPISKIRTNTGQVPGLPRNPRLIRDGRFEALKKSIVDYPDMLDLREIVVFPWKQTFVCVGGNMRFLACKDLGYTTIPAKVLPAKYPVERLAEFAVKDNVSFGSDDYDVIANEWSELPLNDWGMEIAELVDIDLDDFFEEVEKSEPPETHLLSINFKNGRQLKAVMKKLVAVSEELDVAIMTVLGVRK